MREEGDPSSTLGTLGAETEWIAWQLCPHPPPLTMKKMTGTEVSWSAEQEETSYPWGRGKAFGAPFVEPPQGTSDFCVVERLFAG